LARACKTDRGRSARLVIGDGMIGHGDVECNACIYGETVAGSVQPGTFGARHEFNFNYRAQSIRR